ncbi:hypothetical protein ES703_97017 [subsurface metagenome]
MAKLALYMEEDEKNQLTGRWQVGEEGEDYVLDTFDTEEEATAYMIKLQAEFDRNDEIEKEYLEWEKSCISRHSISEEDLRVFLANSVMI